MTDQTYPRPTRELAELRRSLGPAPEDAFQAFSKSVFADGALPGKTKQLIAVAVAHVTQCPYCITGHTRRRRGGPERRRKSSWKRSGSRPRCEPAPRSRIRR
jgi:AhpD family alkylhydroperoxidase